MKALLLVAHGSRRKQSNEEVIRLTEKLKEECSEHYKIIHAGFLELSEPLIPHGIKLCVDDGATSIILLPYFLNSGNHIINDIPSIVDKTRKLHQNVEISIAPHIGSSRLIIDLLITYVNCTDKHTLSL